MSDEIHYARAARLAQQATVTPPQPRKVGEVQRYRMVLGENPIHRANICPIPEPDYYHGEWVRYADLAPLLAEIERLREALDVEARCHEIASDAGHGYRQRATKAEAELEALRVDAERYRWLRSAGDREWNRSQPFICIQSVGGFSLWTGEKADAAIDAALLRDKESGE